MIHYILQILAFQLLFLVLYDLFLKRETFFQWNRLYLVITPILSFILPLVKIDLIRQNIPEEYIIQLPAVILGGSASNSLFASETLETISITANHSMTVTELVKVIWLVGMLLSFALFCYKLYKILKLKRSGTKAQINDLKIIVLPKTDTAFSFFNTIFIGEELSESQKTNILLHEKAHIEQRHSLDLIFFELLRIVCWFNPLVYVFQNKMVLLQEFTADAEAAAQNGKRAYYEGLLAQVFKTESISFINTFFNHSLIKKRIVMLQKSKSKKIFQLKYLLLVPVVCSMLLYTSCAQETNAQSESATALHTVDSHSDILKNIAVLKESIAAKGDMTVEEENALKELVVLTSPEGVNHPYFDDVKDQIEIPFGVIEKVPTYPGCSGDNEMLKKCMAKGIAGFVGKEFNTKVANKAVTGKQKISVKFKIDNKGNVSNVKAKTTHPELRDEAIRVVKLLPKMLPGEHDGKKVAVEYALPIIFDLK